MKRRKHYSAQSSKAGLPPGTLVHTGSPPATGTTTINVLSYSPAGFQEYCPENSDQCVPVKGSSDITWINVEGLHDVELIRHIGECYNLHPLALEDIVNTTQRPKIEDYGEYIFIVIRMIRFLQGQSVETEQVSLILGPGYVLSFQEGIEGDVFEPIRERIRTGRDA